MFLAAFVGTVIWILIGAPVRAEPYFQVRGALNLHTEYSTGSQSLVELVDLARSHQLQVLVISDDDLREVAYGLPFLRQLVRSTLTERALFSDETLDAYLSEIRLLDAAYEDMIILDAVESAPFYFWDFDLPEMKWTLRHWNKHLMAVGLESTEAYRKLPVIGNHERLIWHWTSIIALWPLLGLAYVLWLGRSSTLRVIVGFVSVLCLANNVVTLFKIPEIDPFRGDLGKGPFQRYIDYVNHQGGMTFWSHPEARAMIPVRSVFGMDAASVADAHTEDLLVTDRYTGFAALNNDEITVTEPGREWDRALTEYLVGQRQSPLWGTGGVDCHEDVMGNRIHGITTVFLLRELTRSSVLEALRRGRHYAVLGGDEGLVLSDFSVTGNTHVAVSGQELETPSGAIELSFKLSKLNDRTESLRIRVIRGGKHGAEVVDDFNATAPVEYARMDAIRDGERLYYRLLVSSATAKLTSNPIFVTTAQ